MKEDSFLRALRDHPGDDATRQVYADWLEEQGHADRAAFLRADGELADLPAGDGRREALQARLRELSAGLEIAWRALVARTPVESCAVRFEFACPQSWDRMTPTDIPSVRHCASCDQEVFYCGTIAEAVQHARFGHCVCVDVRLARTDGDLSPGTFVMGRLAPPRLPAWDTSPAAQRRRKQ